MKHTLVSKSEGIWRNKKFKQTIRTVHLSLIHRSPMKRTMSSNLHLHVIIEKKNQ